MHCRARAKAGTEGRVRGGSADLGLAWPPTSPGQCGGGRMARGLFWSLLSPHSSPEGLGAHPTATLPASDDNTSNILGFHFPVMNVTFSNLLSVFKNSLFRQSIITSKFVIASTPPSQSPTAPGDKGPLPHRWLQKSPEHHPRSLSGAG